VLTAHLHCHGISVIPYLDDWIIHHPHRQVILQHRLRVLRTLEIAGFLINEPKSQLIPSQDIQFLGIRFNLLEGYASIPPDSIVKTLQLANKYSIPNQSLIESNQSLLRLNYHQVTSLMGSLNWVSAFVPLGRLHLRPLQVLFHQTGLLNRQSQPALIDRVTLSPFLFNHGETANTLRWRVFKLFHPDMTLYTDTSCHGWGTHMNDMELSGTWTQEESSFHIHCLELKTIIKALHTWIPFLEGLQVLIATDNTSVVSYINQQGGTHSHSLLSLTQELLLWVNTHNITLRTRHIPGRFNVIADRLSRQHQVLTSE
jgi:hypothetical protein